MPSISIAVLVKMIVRTLRTGSRGRLRGSRPSATGADRGPVLLVILGLSLDNVDLDVIFRTPGLVFPANGTTDGTFFATHVPLEVVPESAHCRFSLLPPCPRPAACLPVDRFLVSNAAPY
ncbi:hypothetical protein GCM10027435_25300 [Haloparvum alkalitolerans]